MANNNNIEYNAYSTPNVMPTRVETVWGNIFVRATAYILVTFCSDKKRVS